MRGSALDHTCALSPLKIHPPILKAPQRCTLITLLLPLLLPPLLLLLLLHSLNRHLPLLPLLPRLPIIIRVGTASLIKHLRILRPLLPNRPMPLSRALVPLAILLDPLLD